MSKLTFTNNAPAMLAERLTATILATGKDKSLPMLSNVHLTVDVAGKRMFADATDRFCLIRADLSDLVDEWPDTDVDVKVPAAALTSWVKTLPKRGGDVAEMLFSDGSVTLALQYAGSSQTVALWDGEFVKVDVLLQGCVDDTSRDDTARQSQVILDPKYLALLGKVKSNSLTLRIGGENRAVLATTEHLQIMVMPRRKPRDY